MAIKGFMCSAWRGHNSGSEDNWLFTGRRKKGRQSEGDAIDDVIMHSRTRKGRAKSFTFSNTIEHEPVFLHRSMRSGVYPNTFDARPRTNSIDILSGINNLKNHGPLYSSRYDAPPSTHEQDGFQSTSSLDESAAKYVIDPITNRKISTARSTEPPPAEKEGGKIGLAGLFRVMHDHIEDRRRVATHWNNPPRHDIHETPTQDHKKQCGASVTYIPSNPKAQNKEHKRSCPVQEGLRDYDERVSYGPICTNKPNWTDGTVQQAASVQDGLNEYDQVTSYEPGAFNGKTTPNPESNQDGLKDYDESVSYEPGAFNGEVSTDQQTVKDALNEYDDSMSYEPGEFNGKVSTDKNAVKDGLEEYDDLTSYEPGAFNGEIPGNPEPSSGQELNDYDKTTSYEPGPFNGEMSHSEVPTRGDGLKTYDDATSYEPGSFNGNVIEASDSTNVKDGLKDYDDSMSYEAGKFNENSQSSEILSKEDGLREYDDATSYEPGAFNGEKDAFLPEQNLSRESRPSYPKLARYLEDLDTKGPELYDSSHASTVSPNVESESEKQSKRNQLEKEFGTTQE